MGDRAFGISMLRTVVRMRGFSESLGCVSLRLSGYFHNRQLGNDAFVISNVLYSSVRRLIF